MSFAGGGTDVDPFCSEKGGCVLNATINQYVYGSLIPTPEPSVKIRSIDFDSIIQFFEKEADYDFNGQMDLAKGVIKYFKSEVQGNGGFELYLRGDAPPGSGLGSSSTFTVALIGMFKEWLRKCMTPYEMAELAYVIERGHVGIKGGRQDQYAAAFGGFNYTDFEGDKVIVTPLRLPSNLINELEYSLILCFTGGVRESQVLIGKQVGNYEKGKTSTVDALEATKKLAETMKRALLLGNLDEFGRLLHEGWTIKKRFADGISNPQIDELYAEARKAGAVGGKLLGAGGGGFMLLYCPFNKRHKVTTTVTALGGQVVGFRFEPNGVQSWHAMMSNFQG